MFLNRLPPLEYNLSHPYPRGQLFLIATITAFLLMLPVLILVNFATQGSELVPSLQPRFQPNETLLEGWWGTGRLPPLLRPNPPPCQPKDIGRGDTFRLTTSLFDYTVTSTFNQSQDAANPGVQEQIRAKYTGESFSGCYVNNARFDYSLFDQSQSMMVGIFCPGFPLPGVNVSMQTTMTFAWEISKDFIGQYYGPGLDLLNINDANPSDYRKVVLAVLQVISTDSVTIMRRPHLSSPASTIRIVFVVDSDSGKWYNTTSTLTYANGSQPDSYPSEARIYNAAFANLATVAIDAVNLDLGNERSPNLFRNASRLGANILPNPAPPNILPADWALGTQSFYYGRITPPHQTWAQMLLDGQPVKVGNLTGLPEESVMATTYLCPSYQTKPRGSLLSSVFIGSATMTLSVWGTWMLVTTFIAKRIIAPRVQCECKDCDERREQEGTAARNSGTNRAFVVSGMLARLVAHMGHRGHQNPVTISTDEEQAKSNTDAFQPKPPTDMLDARALSYVSGSTAQEK